MAAQIVKNLKSSKVEEFRKSKAKTWTILRKEDLLDTLKSSRKYINKCLDSIAVMCAKENEKAERIHEKLEMTACYWVMFEEALAHYEAKDDVKDQVEEFWSSYHELDAKMQEVGDAVDAWRRARLAAEVKAGEMKTEQDDEVGEQESPTEDEDSIEDDEEDFSEGGEVDNSDQEVVDEE